MLTISIRQYSFQISEPFAEGTVLTKAEAQALNALRAENIRNNIAPAVADAVEALPPGEVLNAEARQALAEKIARYDQNYKFQTKHRPRKGAVEAEAERVAAERIDVLIVHQGVELTPERYNEVMQEFLALPDVQAEAQRRVEERQRIAQSGLEELL